VIGAIAGGMLAAAVGEINALWIIAVVFAVAAAIALLSPVRNARA
jgi:hypothetical protein